jgi:hypothetical protein
MINCPKCGFTQPKDRYCANCGIDMDLYQPRPTPVFLRLAGNWVVQLTLLVAVVVSALGYIRLQNSASLRERLNEIDNAQTVRITERNKALASRAQISPTPSPTPTALTADAQATPAPAPEPTTPPDAPTAAAVPPPSASPSTAVSKIADTYLADKDHSANGAATLEKAGAPTELRMIFAEVQRANFSEMINDARNLTTYGPFNAGNIADVSGRLKTGRRQNAFRILDTASGLTLKLNQPQVIFKGARDPVLEQNLGVTTQITPTQIDDDGAHLQIEITRTIKDPPGSNPPISTQNFQEQITLNKQSGGFIAGVLPHRNLDAEETKTLGNMGLLKIMTTSDFQSNASEFVIFLQAQ